jgi:type IV pilus assembly protein PilA
MSTELQAKFIQHLTCKRSEKGFTLVELLVVIIIIGILAAIALPNFLNQSAKAKQTEAKQNISTINRVQTLYRIENPNFADSFNKLAIGSLASTTGTVTTGNYEYTLTAANENATLLATAKDTSLKAYSGGNNRYTNDESKSVITSVICEAITPGITAASLPGVSSLSSGPTCPASGYNTLGS